MIVVVAAVVTAVCPCCWTEVGTVCIGPPVAFKEFLKLSFNAERLTSTDDFVSTSVFDGGATDDDDDGAAVFVWVDGVVIVPLLCPPLEKLCLMPLPTATRARACWVVADWLVSVAAIVATVAVVAVAVTGRVPSTTTGL